MNIHAAEVEGGHIPTGALKRELIEPCPMPEVDASLRQLVADARQRIRAEAAHNEYLGVVKLAKTALRDSCDLRW